jgi:hypothetical protein
MLDKDIQLFLYSFPDSNEEEMREQCRNTILEYEEWKQVWEEIEYNKELDFSGTDSEEEDELTRGDLLEDLDKATVTVSPPVASRANRQGRRRSKQQDTIRGRTALVKEDALPCVRMHSEARPGHFPNVPGHDTEGEAGYDPQEAAVPVLLEAPDGQGM